MGQLVGNKAKWKFDEETKIIFKISERKMLFLLAGLAFIGIAKAQSCPEPYGVQTYPNEQYCDKFYNYNWAVDCGKRVYDDTPISSPGCLYQFGLYPVGEGCQTTFFKCAHGVAYETPCP